jgi:hypothetical protein
MIEPIIEYNLKENQSIEILLFHLNKLDVHREVHQRVLLAKHQQIELF